MGYIYLFTIQIRAHDMYSDSEESQKPKQIPHIG